MVFTRLWTIFTLKPIKVRVNITFMRMSQSLYRHFVDIVSYLFMI